MSKMKQFSGCLLLTVALIADPLAVQAQSAQSTQPTQPNTVTPATVTPATATPAAPSATEAAAAQERQLDRLVAYEVELGLEDWRLGRLAHSRLRHAELALPGLGVTQRAYLVYPVKPGPAPVVLMFPEDQGLNSWARSMANEIAGMGYIVVVPDFLAGNGPGGAGREAIKDVREVFRAHSGMTRGGQPRLTAVANFWADHTRSLPEFNGKLGLVGFAWGGGRAAYLASTRTDLSLVSIFYDWVPGAVAYDRINAPLYGFYAEDDPRVTASLQRTREGMAKLGKPYEEVIYPGSEHMFVRLGEEPRDDNPANIAARNASLARLQAVLAKHLQ